jgi:murein DD-endopeptidase MepM/ murein hydrolase activator NlpD
MTRRALVFPLAVAVLMAAGAVGTRGDWPWARLPDVPTALPVLVTSPFRIVSDTLQRGENVATLLRREGITGLDLRSLAAALRFDPRKIQAGLVFQVRRDASTDSATHVEFRPSADESLRFMRTADGTWTGQVVPIRWTTDTVRIAADIRDNLYEAMDRSVAATTLDHAERVRLVYQLADVNAYTIDFARDIQPGDQLVALIERETSEDGDVRFGRLLSSRIIVGDKTYEAFDYPAADGTNAYYDASGDALKRAFLMSPVDFRYISSGFSLARMHPILHLMRKHEGIDYVAPAGSPVRAAGDGVVSIAGWNGGYGNLIEIQHRNGISTRYGHLSHIDGGIRPGTHVSQGEEIGRVGMTGLATGPHLHYEFRVDGIARDPRSIKSAPGAPLAAGSVADFQRQRLYLSQLMGNTAPPSTSVITE